MVVVWPYFSKCLMGVAKHKLQLLKEEAIATQPHACGYASELGSFERVGSLVTRGMRSAEKLD